MMLLGVRSEHRRRFFAEVFDFGALSFLFAFRQKGASDCIAAEQARMCICRFKVLKYLWLTSRSWMIRSRRVYLR